MCCVVAMCCSFRPNEAAEWLTWGMQPLNVPAIVTGGQSM